jgi:hypothetical protein
MEGIEKVFPMNARSPESRWKTTLGDLMGVSEWDRVSDAQGSWLGVKSANIREPTREELFMRTQYALQLAVGQLNLLGGKVLKKHPVRLETPAAFEASIAVLLERLEYYRMVAHIKDKGDTRFVIELMRALKVAEIVQEMFNGIGTGHFDKVGGGLAAVFGCNNLPKDMALKTARKLMSF